MKHLRQSLSIFLLFFVFILAVASVKGTDYMLFALFMGIPLYIMYVAYNILKNDQESDYELKDGWYENF